MFISTPLEGLHSLCASKTTRKKHTEERGEIGRTMKVKRSKNIEIFVWYTSKTATTKNTTTSDISRSSRNRDDVCVCCCSPEHLRRKLQRSATVYRKYTQLFTQHCNSLYMKTVSWPTCARSRASRRARRQHRIVVWAACAAWTQPN